ncbi:DUF3311 domain-containing protein [Streptomyces sp. NPDC019890]|uniref:DUF3311 domain-containing protein n=1 Tax=Streptomyces sp. NPDC019890 TaxID=3365064 RepID=UPI00384EC992
MVRIALPHHVRCRVAAVACLVAPVALWVPWYAQDRPQPAGAPFFHRYQPAWVPGCSLALLAAYLLIRHPPKP